VKTAQCTRPGDQSTAGLLRGSEPGGVQCDFDCTYTCIKGIAVGGKIPDSPNRLSSTRLVYDRGVGCVDQADFQSAAIDLLPAHHYRSNAGCCSGGSGRTGRTGASIATSPPNMALIGNTRGRPNGGSKPGDVANA